MSLTLPNAYTEYVPLDILQAAQLNNDNTNNQYIADNVAPTSNMTAGTITTTTNGNGWIVTTNKSVASVTLQAGTYIVEGSTVVNGSGVSVVSSLRANSVTGYKMGVESIVTANQCYMTLQPHAGIVLQNQATIYLEVHTTAGSADLYGTNGISYLRIK